ncbi:MAG TPA: hypothetical protein VMU84_21550 [Thermoanaerobaculia bacterium]|nr:hypothetical protein [Thermoanaerobaculia bacterium]
MADFVSKIVSDAKNPPEVRVLEGWLGASGSDGYTRLYTNIELNAWIDIPSDAVLHTEEVPDSLPAGAVLVWVKADAVLKPGGSAFSKALPFLQGELAKAAPQAAAAAPAPQPGLPPRFCVTYPPVCSEVTGFTGQCSYALGTQPCATYPPMCLDVTGFTGQCSHTPQPCATYPPMCLDVTGFTGQCSHTPQPCATYPPMCLDVTGFTGQCSHTPQPCPTYPPMCHEVTGFTGQCSFHPRVDPQQQCITYPPRCSEVTGFTGRCSYAPR